MTLFTRQEYMNSVPTGSDADRTAMHRKYYAQFVTPITISAVVAYVGHDRLMKSKCDSFNDITLATWDNAAKRAPFPRHLFAELGDFESMAGLVCIVKEAALQYVESQREN